MNHSIASARGDRVNQAYEKLRELIVWGKIAPGTRIVEIEIAVRLGVSRTPVRSALHRLQQEGYILASGAGKQSRLSVAPLTREDARELFGIVGLVEGLAARWAAERPPTPRARLAEELRRLNAELLHATQEERPDHELIFELDTAFHRRYVEAGAGPRLLSLHDAVKPQAERYVRLYISALVDEIGTSVEEHEEITGAVEAGEPELSQRKVEKNWRNAAERFTRVIDTLGERGSW
ncbi:MAG: GntR family transcriptional regulator [Gemmatimonadetes bacterium]|nr:GntR family transcriptional regulator [Gemmatimonadota bacterium]